MNQLISVKSTGPKPDLILTTPRWYEAAEEIHITIVRRALDAFLVELFDWFQPGNLATIVTHGRVHKTGHAFVLVRWHGLVTEEFRDKLARDSDIVDFRVYPAIREKA